jgi:hypothetical protein
MRIEDGDSEDDDEVGREQEGRKGRERKDVRGSVL